MKNYPQENLAFQQVGSDPTHAKAGCRSSSKVALPLQWALGLLCCVLMGLMAGCNDTPTITTDPCTIDKPTKQPSGTKKPYFGKGATIQATEYNAIAMRPGDTVTLSFPCAVTLPDEMPQGVGMKAKGDKVKLWMVNDRKTVAAKGSGPSPNSPPPPTPTTVTVTFPTPQYTVMVYNDPSLEVWPGDANADGYRNMLDLYAIAQAIKDVVVLDPVTVASGCNLPSPLSYPPNETGDMDYLYAACAWGHTFLWDNQAIDYMHADCNLDGQINEGDADYLRAVMDPMYLPEFLKSAFDGLSLTAAYAPNAGGPVISLGQNGKFVVRLPFDISFATTPSSTFVPDSSFFGVAFSRPVAESPQYKLLDTRLDFGNSGIFVSDPIETVWRQKFWPDFKLEYADGVCADASDRVLDVGAFRLGNAPINPIAPLRIGQCQVTLDDILMPSGSGTPLNSFQLIQHTVNGVVFVRGQDGVVVPQTMECSTDDTTIDLGGICDVNDILLRDGTEDDATFATTPEAYAWSSPDIWVRHAGGPANNTEHQQPINRQDEEVYVRVFNRSCKTSKSGTVDVYWTYANTHEKWRDFSQNHLDPVAIPAIPAYESVVVRLPWRPIFEADANQTPCGTTLSLIAVVNSPVDGVTLPQGTSDVHNWVLSTNNVAMRSTLALETGKSATCAMIALRPESISPKLVVEQVGSPSQLPASHYGDLILQLNGYSATPTNLDHMIVTTGAQRYRLDTDKKSGSLQLPGPISGNASLQISFEPKAGIVLPQLTVAQHYAFRVYIEVGGVAQNSSIVEFTVQ